MGGTFTRGGTYQNVNVDLLSVDSVGPQSRARNPYSISDQNITPNSDLRPEIPLTFSRIRRKG